MVWSGRSRLTRVSIAGVPDPGARSTFGWRAWTDHTPWRWTSYCSFACIRWDGPFPLPSARAYRALRKSNPVSHTRRSEVPTCGFRTPVCQVRDAWNTRSSFRFPRATYACLRGHAQEIVIAIGAHLAVGWERTANVFASFVLSIRRDQRRQPVGMNPRLLNGVYTVRNLFGRAPTIQSCAGWMGFFCPWQMARS